MKQLSKKAILKKTAEVGAATLFSRVLGLIRVMLFSRYLGVGVISDAFLAAYKIPNMLRKIFAEGALSAAFIPHMVSIVSKDGKKPASRLMTSSFIFFEGILGLICILIALNARAVLEFAAPGFKEQIIHAVPFLQVLSVFILFISSSSLLRGALESIHHFFIPAFAPVFMNVLIVSSLLLAIKFSWPVIYICYALIFASCAQFFLHVIAYFYYGFNFSLPDKESFKNLMGVLERFLPVLFGMSIIEINLFIDARFASSLVEGSYTLIDYASRFMGIPLGVFGTAFATIMFPHFGRVVSFAPKRLMFYLYESYKLILWVMLPMVWLMMFFAKDFFSTLLLKGDYLQYSGQAGNVLSAFLVGLIFFSLNKIILNIYYSLKANNYSVIVLLIATVINIFLNAVFMNLLGASGLALATSFAAASQTIMLCYLLKKKYNFKFPFKKYVGSTLKIIINNLIVMPIFFLIFKFFEKIIIILKYQDILLKSVFLWVWLAPIILIIGLIYYLLRKILKIKIYFLDH